MNTHTSEKTKLCWNCEGRVARDAKNCIFCGVYLHPEEGEVERVALEEPMPPYIPDEEPQEEVVHEPPYVAEEVDEDSEVEEFEQAPVNQGDVKQVLYPLLFLLSGSVFLLFSFALYLFSQNGTFVLKWDATYWFVYLFCSIPLLFIGWRSLNSLDD